jgi:putative cell wall-binding protein
MLLHEQSKKERSTPVGALEATAAVAAAACTADTETHVRKVAQTPESSMQSHGHGLSFPAHVFEAEDTQQQNDVVAAQSSTGAEESEQQQQQRQGPVTSAVTTRKGRACLKSLLVELAALKRDQQSLTVELKELKEKNEQLAGDNSRSDSTKFELLSEVQESVGLGSLFHV